MSDPKEIVLPKRLDIEQIRELLGDKAIERLEVGLLRKKAKKVIAITEEELDKVEAILAGQTVLQGTHILGKFTLKRLQESPQFRGTFGAYIQSLRKAAKHGKAKRK